MGASLMHVEDMAGLMTPEAAYELITACKKALKIPVHLHCHCTGVWQKWLTGKPSAPV